MSRIPLFLITLALAMLWSASHAQRVPDPATFLGYEPGKAFTYHHRMVDYFEAVAASSDRVKLIPYGQTNERRPLFAAVLTSEANMKRIEDIRLNNLRLTGLLPGTPTEMPLPIVWLGYNIHGNESVSMEAAMVTLYKLVAEDSAHWLDNVVVIMDPCINPDGRDRYANWYNQVWTNPITYGREGLEHHEPWPGGRFNHYLFDLNRDWCWQTQAESSQRARLYQQWMPHVVVDFHEMGAESSYFFGPAAKPIHALVSDWQMEFQEKVGENNARYFDKAGWLFFTREVYDLLYPSYGDSWSTLNGAVGFTYEQGGSARAGVGLILDLGDTLTLDARMAHHITTGMSTVETAVRNSKKLVDEFGKYFATAREGKVKSAYKSFLLRPGTDPDALPALLRLLDNQQITYYSPAATSRTISGYDYHTQRVSPVKISEGDILVPLAQPNGRMAQAILEPNTYLEDSLTYDLTAWSLVYAYDLPAWALTETPAKGEAAVAPPVGVSAGASASYGYAVAWQGVEDAKFLSQALAAGIRPRFSELPMLTGKETLKAGTLVFTRTDNPGAQFPANLMSLAASSGQAIIPVNNSLSLVGAEMGSSSFHLLKLPKVALIGGKGVSATAYGELWYFLEQSLGLRVDLLSTEYLSSVWLDQYQVVILPDGSYGSYQDQLLGYVRNGGRVIALEEAINLFTQAKKDDKYLTQLGKAMHAAEEAKGKDNPAMFMNSDGEFSYANRERQDLKDEAVGCIVEVKLDPTHPIAFGQDSVYYQIKRRRAVYPLLPPDDGWNVGVFERSEPISGFMGFEMKKRIAHSLAFGSESYGKGEILYFAESPITRGFWRSGQLLLANAIFFGW